MMAKIALIAITWLILDAIVCAGWALIRANQRSRQRQASELARMTDIGGAADLIQLHDGSVSK